MRIDVFFLRRKCKTQQQRKQKSKQQNLGRAGTQTGNIWPRSLVRYLSTTETTKRSLSIVVKLFRGVDNGAAGAATAAPIIWLVVVIQK